MEIAREVGRTKKKDGIAVRDPAQEERVVTAIAGLAGRLDIPGETAVNIARSLIDGAVAVQEDDLDDAQAATEAVVVGSGKMGAWMSRFLSNRGAAVSVFDPRGALEGYDNLESLDGKASEADMIVIASPLGTSREDMERVLALRPQGVVFDLCSVKSHLSDIMLSAAADGLKVTSVHPMFGPASPTPRGENVIICGCGSSEADSAARSLFERAGANVLDVPLDRHDRLIASVLGVPHISALLFGMTTIMSGSSFDELKAVQGPSFRRLCGLARGTSAESRRVYHDIQRLNPNTPTVTELMAAALNELTDAAVADDPSDFSRIMNEQRRYFGGERQ